jgi:hypothetical protein
MDALKCVITVAASARKWSEKQKKGAGRSEKGKGKRKREEI